MCVRLVTPRIRSSATESIAAHNLCKTRDLGSSCGGIMKAFREGR